MLRSVTYALLVSSTCAYTLGPTLRSGPMATRVSSPVMLTPDMLPMQLLADIVDAAGEVCVLHLPVHSPCRPPHGSSCQ